jgi:hypothetical protein
MDERLERALAFANYRTTIENRKKALARRFEVMSAIHYADGLFYADSATISFVAALINDGHTDAIIMDSKSKPITISDMDDFKTKLFETYYAAANEFSTETKKLAKARSVKSAMDW